MHQASQSRNKSKNLKGVRKPNKKSKFVNPKFEPSRVLKPEVKTWSKFGGGTTLIGGAFNPTGVQLNDIPQGAGGSGRVGIKVLNTSMQLRGNILWNGGQTNNAPSQVRFVVVFDRQSNNNAPGRSDVFLDGTLSLSPKNVNNNSRFVTLCDEWSDIGDNGQFTVTWECFRKMRLETIYGPGGVTTCATGGIFIFFAANSGSNDATTAHFPVVELYSTIKFSDS